MLLTLKLRSVCALFVLGLAVSTVGFAQDAVVSAVPSKPAANAVNSVPGPEVPLGAAVSPAEEAPTLPIFQPAPKRVLSCSLIRCNITTDCTRLCGDVATCVLFGVENRCLYS
jgi:hypothetical protein